MGATRLAHLRESHVEDEVASYLVRKGAIGGRCTGCGGKVHDIDLPCVKCRADYFNENGHEQNHTGKVYTVAINNLVSQTRIVCFGEDKTLMEWAEDPRCAVGYSTLSTRIHSHDWPPIVALTTPPQTTKGGTLQHRKKAPCVTTGTSKQSSKVGLLTGQPTTNSPITFTNQPSGGRTARTATSTSKRKLNTTTTTARKKAS